MFHRLRKTTHQSKTELATYVLEVADDGATKTKIMYRTFLSYAQLKEYLLMLTQNGLLAHDIKEEMYRTTNNGIKFIESSRELDDLLKPIAPENRLT